VVVAELLVAKTEGIRVVSVLDVETIGSGSGIDLVGSALFIGGSPPSFESSSPNSARASARFRRVAGESSFSSDEDEGTRAMGETLMVEG
jgi:hypothetical protein